MSKEEIFEEITSLENTGTEPDPMYYAKLFIKIFDLSGIPKKDQKRYLKYVNRFMEVKIGESKNT